MGITEDLYMNRISILKEILYRTYGREIDIKVIDQKNTEEASSLNAVGIIYINESSLLIEKIFFDYIFEKQGGEDFIDADAFLNTVDSILCTIYYKSINNVLTTFIGANGLIVELDIIDSIVNKLSLNELSYIINWLNPINKIIYKNNICSPMSHIKDVLSNKSLADLISDYRIDKIERIIKEYTYTSRTHIEPVYNKIWFLFAEYKAMHVNGEPQGKAQRVFKQKLNEMLHGIITVESIEMLNFEYTNVNNPDILFLDFELEEMDERTRYGVDIPSKLKIYINKDNIFDGSYSTYDITTRFKRLFARYIALIFEDRHTKIYDSIDKQDVMLRAIRKRFYPLYDQNNLIDAVINNNLIRAREIADTLDVNKKWAYSLIEDIERNGQEYLLKQMRDVNHIRNNRKMVNYDIYTILYRELMQEHVIGSNYLDIDPRHGDSLLNAFNSLLYSKSIYIDKIITTTNISKCRVELAHTSKLEKYIIDIIEEDREYIDSYPKIYNLILPINLLSVLSESTSIINYVNDILFILRTISNNDNLIKEITIHIMDIAMKRNVVKEYDNNFYSKLLFCIRYIFKYSNKTVLASTDTINIEDFGIDVSYIVRHVFVDVINVNDFDILPLDRLDRESLNRLMSSMYTHNSTEKTH